MVNQTVAGKLYLNVGMFLNLRKGLMNINLRECIGLGVAGNFANHLAQAGEMKDFEKVEVEEECAPKGIFPFYLPKSSTFLGTFPISNEKLTLPDYAANAQVEPEVVLLCEVAYENNQVKDLTPIKFASFNDCTIRKEGAKKISEKKSWCPESKGLGDSWIDIDHFEQGGVMDSYRLASYVKRNGTLYPYGIDSPVLGYSYFYTKLIQWLINKMNTQGDFGPLENIAHHLRDNDYPKYALVTIGATAYAEFGEKNYLQSGDEVHVVVYNERVDSSDITPSTTKSVLVQAVV